MLRSESYSQDREGTNDEEKEGPSSSKNQATELDSQKLKENAKEVQVTFKLFGTEELFRTLVDTSPRTRQEQIDHGKEAAGLYTGGDYADFPEAFEVDVSYRTEDHFKSLPNAVILSIRKVFIQDTAAI